MDVADITAGCIFTEHTEGEVQDKEDVLTSSSNITYMKTVIPVVVYLSFVHISLYFSHFE